MAAVANPDFSTVPSFRAAREEPKGQGLRNAAVLLAGALYAPFLALPLLSDDYLQLELAQRFISPEGIAALASDPLYRSRATSLILSKLTLVLLGFVPAALHLTSVVLHMLNTWLVFGLRDSPLIGSRLAGVAALIFAMRERHHEAVIWYAALPELLVFTFLIFSLVQWIRWLNTRSQVPDGHWWLAFSSFCLALLSKESAIAGIPLFCLFAWPYRRNGMRLTRAVLPFAAAALAFVVLIFDGAGENHHFVDGTFSLGTHFARTLLNSFARGAWLWGSLALAALLLIGGLPRLKQILVVGFWVFVTLAPYSFVTYMPRIPSRHHYLASVGFSLLIAAGMMAVSRAADSRLVLPALLAVFAAHNSGYLWFWKHSQFLQRSEPYEAVIALAAANPDRPIHVSCFPGNSAELDRALLFRLQQPVRVTHHDKADSRAHLSFCATEAAH